MAIETKSRSSTAEALLLELRRAVDQCHAFNEALAARLGLNLTDLRCSLLVAREGPLTAGQLAATMGLTTGAITGVLDRLERAGFVKRTRDPADRRQVLVASLPAKTAAFDATLTPFLRAAESWSARFPDEVLDAFTRYLQGFGELMQEQAARLRAEAGTAREAADDVVSFPMVDVPAGRLEIRSGASNVRICGAPELEGLFRGGFQGRRPKVEARRGAVRMEYTRFSLFDLRRLASRLELNASIPWAIALEGGVSKLDADLREVRLESLEIRGGLSHGTLHLGRPSGTVHLRLTGGTHRLLIRRPADVPVGLRVSGGANRLTLDWMHFGAVSGRSRVESPAYVGATDRYDVEVTGGASGLTIEAG
ncbi:MAG TPA: MarR family transcriptional regulator [Vulgatibacter sp.]|nr:MarR family transcriptional regulator [Vulgatibacter sp.]